MGRFGQFIFDENNVDSVLAAWQHGITTVQREYEQLTVENRYRLHELATAIMACKKSLYGISAAVEGAGLCASCQGACCTRGKYHFSVVDLLVYLATAKELFVPDFERGACPFLGDEACLMAPEYRPFTCITFNCDLVEAALPLLEQSRFAVQVDQLRGLYREVEALFQVRLSGGLLHYSEKSLAEGRGILLVQ